MARRSLRPHLNQIRSWVRQGRTDAWVAHQLEVTVQEIEQFKRQNALTSEEEGHGGAAGVATSEADGDMYPEEIDLRAEDDARIAAELEAERAKALETEAREASVQAGDEDGSEEEEEEEDVPRARRRRRGGRGRKAGARESETLEGTFDHGEEGYGLWLDPAIQDDPVYAEHWAGHRPVEVTIEEDRIVIRRAGESD
jgi:hypothetical protein